MASGLWAAWQEIVLVLVVALKKKMHHRHEHLQLFLTLVATLLVWCSWVVLGRSWKLSLLEDFGLTVDLRRCFLGGVL